MSLFHRYVKISINQILAQKDLQKRFLSAGTPQDDEKWYVPISYTTSTDSDKCLNTSPRAWLTIQDKLTITDVLKDREWIILNNQQTGKLNL